MLRMPHGTQVNIVQDGTVLYTLDLTFAEDQTCVHMGWLDSGVMPIVCLPNLLSRESASVILDADLSECDGYSLLEVMQTAKPIPILALSSRQRKIIKRLILPSMRWIPIPEPLTVCTIV